MHLRHFFALVMSLLVASNLLADNQYQFSGSNVSIPDATASGPGQWVSSQITISGAPAGAVVTGIDVYFRCVHTYSGDLLVDVNADSTGGLGNYRLWNNEGGAAPNPTRTVNGIHTYDGQLVNRTWYLYARDTAQLDTGYIDEWSITVYYNATTPGSFTLSNDSPICDTNPPVAPAVRLNWTTSSAATSYSVYRNGSLYFGGISGLTFNNNFSVVAGQSYTYFVRASNSAGTRDSNPITVAIPSNICGQTPCAANLGSPTSSASIAFPQAFSWTVAGSCSSQWIAFASSPTPTQAITWYSNTTSPYTVQPAVWSSILTQIGTAGTYYWTVGEVSNNIFAARASWRPFTITTTQAPANDSCTNATTVTSGSIAFSTVGATTDGPIPTTCPFAGSAFGADVWFTYTASATGVLTVDTCGSGFDTVLAVYDGGSCPVPNANPINCNDDSCNGQSRVGVHVTAGNGYKIRVGGYNGATGTGTLQLTFIAPQPPQYPTTPPPTAQTKLILVTHGFNTNASDYANFWEPLKAAIVARVGPDWEVRAYNWTEDCGAVSRLPGEGPDYALMMGRMRGNQLGYELGHRTTPYEYVHLISHSAGSSLITTTAYWLKEFARRQSRQVTVHTTYLDAFAGTVLMPTILGGEADFRTAYGANADWSDHYTSQERFFLDPLCLPQISTGDDTFLRLANAYNFDVTLVDPNYSAICLSSHGWPTCFYRYTVDAYAVGGSPSCGTPTWDPPLNVGFALSYERWLGTGGVNGWLNSVRGTYPATGAWQTLAGPNPNLTGTFQSRTSPSINLGTTPVVSSSPSAVQVATNAMTMTTLPQGSPAPVPAWANFQVTTAETNNFIAFDMTFANNPGAAGLMTLYIDGVKRGVVDEPYALTDSRRYAMPTPGDLAPGQHLVSFRLDPFNSVQSNITIANVATGMGEIVPASSSPIAWTQLPITGPSPRGFQAMAYDTARGVTVLFGGYPNNGETWELSGSVWTQKMVSGPTPRQTPTMVYDAARGVTVLFGGYTNNGANGETWEWNGAVWTQRMVSGPAPRFEQAMVYDAARGVSVLFGGYTDVGTQYNGETWEWNGSVWTQRMVAGPTPRLGHAMAYDAGRAVAVLYGGNTGGVSAETWEWNGTAWTQRTASGPGQLEGHTMAYDAARGVTVLFGGYDGGPVFSGNTWEWNGTVWTQRLINGPTPRQFPAMVYDTARGAMVLFGGRTADFVSSGETWTLGVPCVAPSITTQPVAQTVCAGSTASFTTNAAGTPPLAYQWRTGGVAINAATTPSAATSTLMLANVQSASTGSYDCVVSNACGTITSTASTLSLCSPGACCVGNSCSLAIQSACTGTWNAGPCAPNSCAPIGWIQRFGSGPTSREGHAMAYDTARGVTVLFGGITNDGTNDETWEWNGTAWTQRVVSGPSPRQSHAMAYDSVRGVTVLFGGYRDSSGRNSETWEWNGTAWTQRMVSGPSPRYFHAMAYDAARGVTVLFGGYGTNDETWEWNGTTWTQRMVNGPSPRIGHAMGYDAVRNVIVLFGGRLDGPVPNGETWEWNGTAWTQRMVSGPSPRFGHAMASNATGGVVTLFGGTPNPNTELNGETWQWNGIAWIQRMISGPSPRYLDAMVYDTARGVMVLFGGYTGTNNGETWELCGAPIVTAQPAAQVICAGGSASFAINAAGTAPLTYQWRTGGIPIDPASVPSAATAMLTLANVQSASAGSYDCIVSNACGTITSAAATLALCPTGACCANGLCSTTTAANCAGVWTTGTSCSPTLCPPIPCHPPAFVIQPGPEGKDTSFGTVYEQGGSPDSPILRYGGWGDSYSAFLQFDLAGSPSALVTTSCVLRLYAATAPNDPGLRINRVTQDWTEAGVNISHYPASDFYTDFGTLLAPDGWKSVDISQLYRDWKNGVSPNFGIKLYPTSTNHTNGSFLSSDDAEPSTRPMLVITYTTCPADFNCSGAVNITDIFDFLSGWFTMQPRADFNGVNGINIQDIFDFLAAWFAGC